jgi:hypothetical protein
MKRAALLGILCCAAAAAQNNSSDLASLEQTAQKRYAEWQTLAKDLTERIARILPCDPRYAAAISEVSNASETRLAALSDYLRAVTSKAFAETATAKLLLDAEEKRAVEVALERADAGQEQTAIATQSDALGQSVTRRASLAEPQTALSEILKMAGTRVNAAEQLTGEADRNVALLRELVSKFDARDAALREESVAFEAERVRWNAYYAARLARAQTECSITQIGPAPSKGPARAKGKQ